MKKIALSFFTLVTLASCTKRSAQDVNVKVLPVAYDCTCYTTSRFGPKSVVPVSQQTFTLYALSDLQADSLAATFDGPMTVTQMQQAGVVGSDTVQTICSASKQ